jgi:hypothetical protein
VKDFFVHEPCTVFSASIQRNWALPLYNETHCVLADAHNSGAVARYTANGVEFARVIERETACKICRRMRGKAIWLGVRGSGPRTTRIATEGLHPCRASLIIPFALRTPRESRR